MRNFNAWLCATLLVATAGGTGHFLSTIEASPDATLSARAASWNLRAERLGSAYDRWRKARIPEVGADEFRIRLSWFPGISAERSMAIGLAVIDQSAGTVSVEVTGIDTQGLGEVWLIDNRPSAGASSMPDANDLALRLGSLRVDGDRGRLRANLGAETLRDFDIDRVVVARPGEGPIDGGVLYGSPMLFERLLRMSRRVERGLAPIAGADETRGSLLGRFPGSAAPTATSPAALELFDVLIDEGEDIFNHETFDGNGRTCASCHPAENNFTLDRDFIATLPPDDPLFVAEFIDELNHELNGGLFFENPVLMREFALIVENADGFDDLATDFVVRSVSHVFAQALTIHPNNQGCEPPSPVHSLGWSGDGAPGSGSLREFATGAVIQHSPLTLGRVDGVDFRLPTDTELDSLEAFQLSLGRQEELDLESMVFTDPNVQEGQDLFIRPFTEENGGKCQSCHRNAGSNSIARTTPDDQEPHNLNLDIGISQVQHPAMPLGELMPFDDGFGIGQTTRRCRNQFNVPSLIEAADTPPFFHDNVFDTLEDAIAHYSSIEFNLLSQMGRELPRPIRLTDQEVNQIGALLRVLNALRNIDDILECDARASAASSLPESRQILKVCRAHNIDAIQVLSGSPLAPLHPLAQSHLDFSLDLHVLAGEAPTAIRRDSLLASAALRLSAARADMVTDSP